MVNADLSTHNANNTTHNQVDALIAIEVLFYKMEDVCNLQLMLLVLILIAPPSMKTIYALNVQLSSSSVAMDFAKLLTLFVMDTTK